MEYKASWDTLVKVVSALFIPFIVLINYLLAMNLSGLPNNSFAGYTVYATIPLLVLVVLGSYLYAPTKYRVDNNGLSIIRPLQNRVMPFYDIKSISQVDEKVFKWNIRVFGVGGLFGYFGIFRNPQLGNYTLYGTQRKNFILIETNNNKKLVITPDDISLIDEVKKHLA